MGARSTTRVRSRFTARDVLLKAAEILEAHKLAQRDYARDANGNGCEHDAPGAVAFCVVGSIRRACDVLGVAPGLDFDASEAVADVLGTSVTEWNDRPGRKKADVVAKLREAAGVVS